MRCFGRRRPRQPHGQVMEREGWKTAVGKSCGQAGNLGSLGNLGTRGTWGTCRNLQLPSCRSHAVSSSGFSISSYSDTLQCVSFRSRRSPHVFWCKGEAGRPGETPAGQLLVLLEQRLGNPAGSGTPAMQGRPATQPCARDRWKLTVFFGTEIFMGQEPHGSSQWPWI